MGRKIKRKDLIYKSNNYKYDFQQYETIRSFCESIYPGKINLDEVKMDQSNSLKTLEGFIDKSRPRTARGKKINKYLWNFKWFLWRSRINS